MVSKRLGQGIQALALRAWASKGVGVAAALLFFALFVRLGMIIFQETIPPFEYHSATVLTPKVKIGEPVVVVYMLKRNRICNTVISTFFLDSEGTAIYRSVVPGGYTGLGEHTTKVVINLPFMPTPGKYTYRAILNSDCGFSTYTILVPDAVFDVVI